MSGDVQPRKRKDKKKKKEELSVEEPKGTSAIFGEGDIFLHSQHDHGTGGHWCAKIIFFSLLAILVTLIALIIMENRGLSELEANTVESRYSGMLEGWLEEGADDDHHDVHTLELKHHDDDDEEASEFGIEDRHTTEDLNLQEKPHQSYFFMSYFGGNTDNANGENKDDEEDLADDDEDNDSEEQNQLSNEKNDEENLDDDEGFDEPDNLQGDNDDDEDNDDNYKREADDDEDEDSNYKSSFKRNVYDDNEQDDNDDNEDQAPQRNFQSYNSKNDGDDDFHGDDDDDDNENFDKADDDDDSYENKYNREVDNDDEKSYYENEAELKDDHEDDDGDEHDDDDDEPEIEIERIEREVEDDEPISVELPVLPEEDDDDDDADDADRDESSKDDDIQEEDDDFLDNDIDDDLPIVEHITAPSGKPFKEVDNDDSTEESPVNTLADEEEYEKKQEQIRREQEEASHIWLKVGVGCALLVATHAVVRRALATRGDETENEIYSREETPVRNLQQTLVPEQATTSAPVKAQERTRKVIQEEISKRIPAIVQSAPTPTQMSLDDEIEPLEEIQPNEQASQVNAEEQALDKELYSDEEDEDKEAEGSEVEEELPDDVEIIDDDQIEDEQLDEQIEEEEEDEISDVDDVELLTRLEAKYGKLPENKNKDGGNSVEDDLWPGEPSDPFWRQELDRAEDDLHQGRYGAALSRAGAPALATSSRGQWIQAAALDAEAELKRDNALLGRAINVYRSLLLDFNERLSDKKLLEITNRTIDRMFFKGAYLKAEPIYRLLIGRFPDEPGYRNNLTISFLMANRADLAANVLNETLKKWPEDPIALVHYGFVLKTHYNKLEESVELFKKALEDVNSPANEPRFYYHYGDALLLLGRREEADEVHTRGAKLGHFLSPMQRSLYNVERLKSRPWWNIEQTPYANLARNLERNWKSILKEGIAAKELYEREREGLRERGDWSQMDLFLQGREVAGRCARAAVSCGVVRGEPGALCRRGQVKFSAMEPGTHVRAHTGPTNCRLRLHLALSNTTGTFMRVGTEIREWQLGKVWLFDDSFEHEVWHNGTGTRLVLIVDLWHPDLTPQERRQLPAI